MPPKANSRDLTGDVDDARAVALAVAFITAIALALRWIAAQESLFADELYTYADTTVSSLGHVFDRMDQFREQTPPLFYILAWLSAKLGDPSTLIRLPTVIAGAAAVPVIYLLGDGIAGRASGIFAAALFAVMPFAVFYGSEARAYGMLLLLLPLSTLALLKALDGGKFELRWWLLFCAASIAALYTHYIAVIAVGLQAAWALLTQPGRRRAVLAANAVVGLAFLPWYLSANKHTDILGLKAGLHPLTLHNFVVDSLSVVFGHPSERFDQVPGTLSVVVACAVGAVIAVRVVLPRLGLEVAVIDDRGQVRRNTAAPPSWRAHGSFRVPRVGWLFVAMTLGIFAVTLAYSLIKTSIYEPRAVITPLPYFCILGGAAAAALRGRAAVIAAGTVVLAALLGTLRMIDYYPRPDLRGAADVIASRAPPGTPVVEGWRFGHNPFETGLDPLQQGLAIYLNDQFPISHPQDAGEWPRGRDVYAVDGGVTASVDGVAANAGARPVETISFPGLRDITLTQYSALPTAGEAAKDPVGVWIATHPEAFHEYLEQHPAARKRFNKAVGERLASP